MMDVVPDQAGMSAKLYEPSDDVQLDAGIRHAVIALRQPGIETFESCQGGPGHAFPEPTIRFHGEIADGYKAVAVAMECGLPIAELRRVWTMNDGELRGPCWELTFTATFRGD